MTGVGLDSRAADAGGPRLALVGMHVTAAGLDGAAEFERVLYQEVGGANLPAAFDFHLTSTDLADLGLANDATGGLGDEDCLLLRCAARALRDAGAAPEARYALLYSRGADLALSAAQAAGTPLPRVPVSLPCLGASMTNLSAEPNPLASGLLEARRLLEAGEVDLVVLAGAALLEGLAGQPQVASARKQAGPLRFGLDEGVEGWTFGEGAAALVVMAEEAARKRGARVYARVEALGWAPKDLPGLKKNLFPTLVSPDTITQACQSAFAQFALDARQVGYLEMLASGHTPLDGAEMAGLARAYPGAAGSLTCALGSAAANTGYLFNAAGLAALAKTALCLHLRALPALPGWSQAKKPEWLEQTCFYLPGEAHTWFLPAGGERRLAALHALGRDGSSLHLLLSEAPDAARTAGHFLEQQPGWLFPLVARSQADLENALRDLRREVEQAGDFKSAAHRAFADYQRDPDAPLALCLAAVDAGELLREADFALRDLPAAFAQARPWQTPAGSYFTPLPVGREGGVAFVYPGAFNSYLGLGRDLFHLFPRLYPRASALTARLRETIQERKLYPRSQRALSKDELAALEAQLNDDPIAMITTGSLIAVLFTMIVRDIFQVKPSAAFGYSLGEIAMLFGTEVWTAADETSDALKASPLFRSQLSGPQNAVRAAWGLPPVAQGGGEALWSNYFLMTSPERAREAVAAEPRAYLTHVNTPRQVVIGGDPQACRSVIERLKCTSLKAPFDFALHCEAIRGEYDAMVRLHSWPVSAVPNARLYTAADYRPLPVERDAIAEKISRMLTSSLDFPALVQQVYADGARVFIELGANANCSRWIEDTLKGSPFVSVAINRKGADDHASILRMLARLVSHRVPLDLTPLYP